MTLAVMQDGSTFYHAINGVQLFVSLDPDPWTARAEFVRYCGKAGITPVFPDDLDIAGSDWS